MSILIVFFSLNLIVFSTFEWLLDYQLLFTMRMPLKLLPRQQRKTTQNKKKKKEQLKDT